VAEQNWKREQENDSKHLARFLAKQWPCDVPTTDGHPISDKIDVAQALEDIQPMWQRLTENWELSEHISEVQKVLDQHYTKQPPELARGALSALKTFQTRNRSRESTLLRNLLRKPGPTFSHTEPGKSALSWASTVSRTYRGVQDRLGNPPQSHELQELKQIIDGFMTSESTVRQQYGADLLQSLEALGKAKDKVKKEGKLSDPSQLPQEIKKARAVLEDRFNLLCKALENGDSRVYWLQQGGMWPNITPVTLLETLRSTTSCVFGKGMKESLIAYALSITALQRLLRIEYANQKNNQQRLLEEWENEGHGNWDPLEYCDWLLLEIDATGSDRRCTRNNIPRLAIQFCFTNEYGPR
jgi:hypothetical protein